MYKILKKKYFLNGIEYSVIQKNEIEIIRKLRNSQIKILRQNNFISVAQQVKYFNEKIIPDYKKKKPKNILLAIRKSTFLGYCGLTNIDWNLKKAEISFLVLNKISLRKKKFVNLFDNSLKVLETIFFDELHLSKLQSETYSFRTEIIDTLKNRNFIIDGVLKNNVKKNNSYFDSYLLSKFKCQKIIKDCNFLITSSSNKVPLIDVVKKSLCKLDRDYNLYCGDSNPKVVSKLYNKKFIILPKINESNRSKILQTLKQFNINFVLPTSNVELLFWSKNKQFFKKNSIDILVTDINPILICSNKLKFYNKLNDKNIKCAFTTKNVDLIKTKFIVKSNFGSGGNLFFKNPDQLLINSLKKKDLDIIFQPLLKGKEISIDTWTNKKSNKIYILMRKRLVIKNGESEVSVFINNKNIEKIIKKVILILEINGTANFQGFLHKKIFTLLECNPRVGGATTFSFQNGLDFIYWSILDKLNKFTLIENNKPKKLISTIYRIKKDLNFS